MTLISGSSLGPYEIVAPLGAGGMGEVYKARDTRLDRTVAIKVLSKTLAADPQFRERFDREARALSQLTHPHICTLYDVGAAYLVMEYLEGETLADRLAKGALPLDTALTLAIQISDAIHAAHRAGIVHRDLKPGNVMITRGGAKLLDFGLAKAGGANSATSGLSMLPTTPPTLTAHGTILGTFQYMAPEQLEGHEADERSDLFAFGAVLYEMVTGRKAFEGKSHASLISSIMSSHPAPASSLVTVLPAALDHVIARCLAKAPDDRWQSARDVTLHLAWILEDPLAPARVEAARRPSRERIAWSAAALILAAAAAAITALVMWRPAGSEASTSQFVIEAPAQTTFAPGINVQAISPDGRQIVFVAIAGGVSQLWLRPLAVLAAQPINGTEDAVAPFWSPDSRSIGFFARGKLKRVNVAGGAPQTLADAPASLGGAWSREGVIVFAPQAASALLRVPAGGGAPVPVTALDEGSKTQSHGWPFFLPDGHHFLYLNRAALTPANWDIYVGSLDGKPGVRVVPADSAAMYAPPGYLLFMRGTTLMAQAFDATALAATGDAIPVAERIGANLRGGAAFAVSADGTLIYRTGALARTRLVWVDRTGKSIAIAAPEGQYTNMALSPDGSRVAFDRATTSNDVWLLDLRRNITSRLTIDPPLNNVPIWSPDGQDVVFASSRSGGLDLFRRPANASRPDELLLKLSAPPIVFPSDWSADGRFITYYRSDPDTQLDTWMLPMSGDRKAFPYLKGPYNESQGQFSRDGRWLAYVSDETGRPEVYVQSFPTLTGKWQVSTEGGSQPRWQRDGKELFYVAADRKLMSVAIPVGATFETGSPRALFETTLVGSQRQAYAVAADGQRFLMNVPLGDASAPLTVVLNWPALLKP